MWLHLALSWADSSPSRMAADLFSLSVSLSFTLPLALCLSLLPFLSLSLFLCLYLLLCLSLSAFLSLSGKATVFTEWWLSSKKAEGETGCPLKVWAGNPRILLCHIL